MAHGNDETNFLKRIGRKGGSGGTIKWDKAVAGAVEIMAYSQMTQAAMAAQLNISVPTLKKLYSAEIANGKDKMTNALMKVDLKVALDPKHKDSAKCRHFQLERRGGMTKTETINYNDTSIESRLRRARTKRMTATEQADEEE